MKINLTTDLIFIGIIMAMAWPLSAYDSRVTGEDPKADFLRRLTRCSITLGVLLMSLAAGPIRGYIFLAIGIGWASCGAEFGSRQIHKLFDPEDKRDFDPKHAERGLEMLSKLVHEGHTRQALDWAQTLLRNAEASPDAVEAMVNHVYLDLLESTSSGAGFAEVQQLRQLGQFTEAETRLNEMIAAQPDNAAAMLLLMRMYSEDLNEPGRALALLQPAEKQPRLHPALVKYARKSIDQWSSAAFSKAAAERVSASAASTVTTAPAAIELSVDELLNLGQRARAIQRLERMIVEEPENFDAWLKLAEAHAVYCADLTQAGKVVRAMEVSGRFAPEQITEAKAKLKEWQMARPHP